LRPPASADLGRNGAPLVQKLCEEDAARFTALGERRLKGFADMTPVFRFE
jgi:hypothetical protein